MGTAWTIEGDEGGGLNSLALAGVAKNEGMFILDWVIFHIASGFDEVLIADDDSFDGSLELVEALGAFLPVRSLRLAVDEHPKQQNAYKRALGVLDCELVAFADLDEFYSSSTSEPAAQVIKEVFKDDLVSALAVNWQIAGTANALSSFGAPIRYAWLESGPDFRKNNYFKSIVRRSRVERMNVHEASLKMGLYIHVDQLTHLTGPSSESTLGAEENYPCGGISTKVFHEPLRVIHFATKGCIESFYLSRSFRKRASVKDSAAGVKANRAFWTAHNPSGPENGLPATVREGFDELFAKTLKSLVHETDLLSGITLDIDSVEYLQDGTNKVVATLDGELAFDCRLEISMDGRIFAEFPLSRGSGKGRRTVEVRLPENGLEFFLRIPGVLTSRPRLFRSEGKLIVDEIYQELTFRHSRAERLLLQERLSNLEAEQVIRQLEESSALMQKQSDEILQSQERTITVLQNQLEAL